MQTLPTKIFTSLAMDMVAWLDQRKQDMDDNLMMTRVRSLETNTVEPRLTDTPQKQTPRI